MAGLVAALVARPGWTELAGHVRCGHLVTAVTPPARRVDPVSEQDKPRTQQEYWRPSGAPDLSAPPPILPRPPPPPRGADGQVTSDPRPRRAVHLPPPDERRRNRPVERELTDITNPKRLTKPGSIR